MMVKWKPLVRSNKMDTTSQSFITLLRVSIAKPSKLHTVNLFSDNDAVTEWKIGFNPRTYTTFQAVTPKELVYPEIADLEPGDEILIQVRSTDGTSITLDAHVTLMEKK